jgi:hypothetical protein
MQLLANLHIHDVQDQVQNLIAEGYIDEGDLNKTILEMIGTLWVSGDTSAAANLTNIVLGNTTRCFELLFEDESIAASCPEIGDDVAIASRLASGYKKGKAMFGYMARAWATKSRKYMTSVFPFNPQGSGNVGGVEDKRLEIKKKFFLNATEILEGTLWVSVHTGQAATHAQNEFLVNGVNYLEETSGTKCPYCWEYICCIESVEKEENKIVFYRANITKDLVSGWNEVEIVLFKPTVGIATHIHPGTRVEVKYKTDEEVKFYDIYNETLFFDNIKSPGKGAQRGGVWALMPIYAPKDSIVKNATLHLRGLNIKDDPKKIDVRIFFNNESIFNDSNPSSTYELWLDLTSYLSQNKNRTNVLSVYLNTFGEEFWGEKDKDVILYSDPEDNPSDSSFIYIEYESPPFLLKYGYINVDVVEKFTGLKSNPKNHTTDFGGYEISRSFLHIAQLDSHLVNITVQPGKLVFKTPLARALPSSVYIDPPYFNPGNNRITIAEECTLFCEILNESSFEYMIYVPAHVGYGDIFDNASAAQEDALARLNKTLAEYADLIEFELELGEMVVGGIPWLWGPSLFTLLVW